MSHEFAPKKKSIEDFTQEQLEEILEVKLAPGLSKEDFVFQIKSEGYCRVLVDADFNIHLGKQEHDTIRKNLGYPNLLVDDAYLETTKNTETRHGVSSGRYGIFSIKTYYISLIKAVEVKTIKYLESIGINTK